MSSPGKTLISHNSCPSDSPCNVPPASVQNGDLAEISSVTADSKLDICTAPSLGGDGNGGAMVTAAASGGAAAATIGNSSRQVATAPLATSSSAAGEYDAAEQHARSAVVGIVLTSPETGALHPACRTQSSETPTAAPGTASAVGPAVAVEAHASPDDARLQTPAASAYPVALCRGNVKSYHNTATAVGGIFAAAKNEFLPNAATAKASVVIPAAATASASAAVALPTHAVNRVRSTNTVSAATSAAATISEEKPATVVLDTGAFLRLQQMGGSSALLHAEERLLSRRRWQQQQQHCKSQSPRRIQFVAPASVLMEIRDARSRMQALQQQQWVAAAADSSLPLVMSATEADKRWARTFAAKTGDLPALSNADLDVIALTYMLQRQTGQVERLRDKPVETVCVQPRIWGSSSNIHAATAAGEAEAPVRTTAAKTNECKSSDRRVEAATGPVVAGAKAEDVVDKKQAAEVSTPVNTLGRGAAADTTPPVGVSEEEDTELAAKQEEDHVESIESVVYRRGSKAVVKQRSSKQTDSKKHTATCDTTSLDEGASNAAIYERGGTTRGIIAARGRLFGAGVQETCDLMEFDSDEERDDAGEWISLENIEQLKRNAAALVFEESGFPSPLPQHDAASFSVVSSTSSSNSHTKRQTDVAAAKNGEDALLAAAAGSEDAVDGVLPESSERIRAENKEDHDGEADFLVACKTTDYSVQNVLLHMGLHVLAVDGYAIRSLKTWALLCRGCQHVTRDVSRLFCPKCGQHAVDRVPVSFDGKEYVVFDNRKKKTTRGLVYSLPKPKGGRHEKPLILAEDQLLMGGRDRLLRHQQRVWETENADHNFFTSAAAAASHHCQQQSLNEGTSFSRLFLPRFPPNPSFLQCALPPSFLQCALPRVPHVNHFVFLPMFTCYELCFRVVHVAFLDRILQWIQLHGSPAHAHGREDHSQDIKRPTLWWDWDQVTQTATTGQRLALQAKEGSRDGLKAEKRNGCHQERIKVERKNKSAVRKCSTRGEERKENGIVSEKALEGVLV